MSGVLAVRAEDGDARLVDGIADEWRALCDEGARDEPFYRPEWIGAYLSAFDPHARLLLLTARDGPRLRAVLPLVQRIELVGGLPARVLESPSNVHSCRFDVVHGEHDGEAAIASLWEYVKQREGWDVLWMNDVPSGGAGDLLLSFAARDGWPVGQWETNRSPFILTAGTTDALAHDRHFRANLRRRLRKASQTSPIALQRTERADDGALEQFYAIEAGGWKGRAATAITSSTATRCFYDAVAHAAARFGYLSLYILRFGGEPVAGHFGLSYKGRYYTPKVAYDERYAAFGPGHLIVDAVLRDGLERGIVEFDFLGPTMPWKLEWTSRVRPHSRCYIFRNSVFGGLLHLARFRMEAPLRPLVRRARSVLSRAQRP
jgi:CelD/BcsL family acetyltransferase involved in cellulose biosynthesis